MFFLNENSNFKNRALFWGLLLAVFFATPDQSAGYELRPARFTVALCPDGYLPVCALYHQLNHFLGDEVVVGVRDGPFGTPEQLIKLAQLKSKKRRIRFQETRDGSTLLPERIVVFSRSSSDLVPAEKTPRERGDGWTDAPFAAYMAHGRDPDKEIIYDVSHKEYLIESDPSSFTRVSRIPCDSVINCQNKVIESFYDAIMAKSRGDGGGRMGAKIFSQALPYEGFLVSLQGQVDPGEIEMIRQRVDGELTRFGSVTVDGQETPKYTPADIGNGFLSDNVFFSQIVKNDVASFFDPARSDIALIDFRSPRPQAVPPRTTPLLPKLEISMGPPSAFSLSESSVLGEDASNDELHHLTVFSHEQDPIDLSLYLTPQRAAAGGDPEIFYYRGSDFTKVQMVPENHTLDIGPLGLGNGENPYPLDVTGEIPPNDFLFFSSSQNCDKFHVKSEMEQARIGQPHIRGFFGYSTYLDPYFHGYFADAMLSFADRLKRQKMAMDPDGYLAFTQKMLRLDDVYTLYRMALNAAPPDSGRLEKGYSQNIFEMFGDGALRISTSETAPHHPFHFASGLLSETQTLEENSRNIMKFIAPGPPGRLGSRFHLYAFMHEINFREIFIARAGGEKYFSVQDRTTSFDFYDHRYLTYHSTFFLKDYPDPQPGDRLKLKVDFRKEDKSHTPLSQSLENIFSPGFQYAGILGSVPDYIKRGEWEKSIPIVAQQRKTPVATALKGAVPARDGALQGEGLGDRPPPPGGGGGGSSSKTGSVATKTTKKKKGQRKSALEQNAFGEQILKFKGMGAGPFPDHMIIWHRVKDAGGKVRHSYPVFSRKIVPDRVSAARRMEPLSAGGDDFPHMSHSDLAHDFTVAIDPSFEYGVKPEDEFSVAFSKQPVTDVSSFEETLGYTDAVEVIRAGDFMRFKREFLKLSDFKAGGLAFRFKSDGPLFDDSRARVRILHADRGRALAQPYEMMDEQVVYTPENGFSFAVPENFGSRIKLGDHLLVWISVPLGGAYVNFNRNIQVTDDTLYVSADGIAGLDFETALEIVPSGGVIVLGPGVYDIGNFTVGKNITVRGHENACLNGSISSADGFSALNSVSACGRGGAGTADSGGSSAGQGSGDDSSKAGKKDAGESASKILLPTVTATATFISILGGAAYLFKGKSGSRAGAGTRAGEGAAGREMAAQPLADAGGMARTGTYLRPAARAGAAERAALGEARLSAEMEGRASQALEKTREVASKPKSKVAALPSPGPFEGIFNGMARAAAALLETRNAMAANALSFSMDQFISGFMTNVAMKALAGPATPGFSMNLGPVIQAKVKAVRESDSYKDLTEEEKKTLDLADQAGNLLPELMEIQKILAEVYFEVFLKELEKSYPQASGAAESTHLFLTKTEALFNSRELSEALASLQRDLHRAAADKAAGALTGSSGMARPETFLSGGHMQTFDLIRLLMMITDQTYCSVAELEDEDGQKNRLAGFLCRLATDPGNSFLEGEIHGLYLTGVRLHFGALRRVLESLDDPEEGMRNLSRMFRLAVAVRMAELGGKWGLDTSDIQKAVNSRLTEAEEFTFDQVEALAGAAMKGGELEKAVRALPFGPELINKGMLGKDMALGAAGEVLDRAEKAATETGGEALKSALRIFNGDFRGAGESAVKAFKSAISDIRDAFGEAGKSPEKLFTSPGEFMKNLFGSMGKAFKSWFGNDCDEVRISRQEDLRLFNVKFGGGTFALANDPKKRMYHLTGRVKGCPEASGFSGYAARAYVPAESSDPSLYFAIDMGDTSDSCQNKRYGGIGTGPGSMWFGWWDGGHLDFKSARAGEGSGTWWGLPDYGPFAGDREIGSMVSGKDGMVWALDDSGKIHEFRDPNHGVTTGDYAWSWRMIPDPRPASAGESALKELLPLEAKRMIAVNGKNELFYSASSSAAWKKIWPSFKAIDMEKGIVSFSPGQFDLFHGPGGMVFVTASDAGGNFYASWISGEKAFPLWMKLYRFDKGIHDFDFSDDGRKLAILDGEFKPHLVPVNDTIDWAGVQAGAGAWMDSAVMEALGKGELEKARELMALVNGGKSPSALPAPVAVVSLSGKSKSPDPVGVSWRKAAGDNRTRFYHVQGGRRDSSSPEMDFYTTKNAFEIPMNAFSDGVIYARVRAMDMDGSQSPFTELGERIKDTTPPERVTGIAAALAKTPGSKVYDAVRVFWNPSRDRDFARYRIYKIKGASRERLAVLDGLSPAGERTGAPNAFYMDAGADAGAWFQYAATAVDDAGNENLLAGLSAPVFLNNAPSLPGGARAFSPIPEDERDSSGDLVSRFLQGASDPEGDAVGMAVISADSDGGRWEYRRPGGDWTAFVSASPIRARLLEASDRIRFVPLSDWNGDATITFRAWDKTKGMAGRTADVSGNGEYHPYSAHSASASVTVRPVNDPPSFVRGPDLNIIEDSGAQVVENWASEIAKGPGDESGQRLSFVLAHDREAPPGAIPDFFHQAPAMDENGRLTYALYPDANGTANVTVRLRDDGGVENGGIDADESRPPVRFTITARPVNDPPSFSALDQTVDEDAGIRRIPLSDWAQDIRPGPENEKDQTVGFTVVSTSSPGLFSAPPSISPDGVLIFSPALDQNGQARVTVRARDDGGVENEGVDQSAPVTFGITVRSVNDAPSFSKGADIRVRQSAGRRVLRNWARQISAGPADESGQRLHFEVKASRPSLFAVQPAISSGGTLTFTPRRNRSGKTSVTAVLKDGGGKDRSGEDQSAPARFNIRVLRVSRPGSDASNDAPSQPLLESPAAP
ncbi:hypothetical protein EPICR_160005 [Candidatus Desulfarcum epimagneticum]|uniref:Cadherin domain-containing protein n=1 Tax=uncultured Desulfobacteraceae bacterium TaxID=218296 RepID=A0A484HF56_9BACT|nr:hypothetical protein EPICR_160005 [uncultured Desulfobacteraceae bacterium]